MINPKLYSKFFAAHRRACLSLGFLSKEKQQEYYRRVCLEHARVLSIKQISSLADFDRCLARFAADADDFQSASNYEIENQRRRAYIVKVLCAQICQLNQVPILHSRAYFEGVLKQSKLGASFHASGETFYLDIPACNLQKILQILDTHLRRLKSRLSANLSPTFDWRVKFEFKPDGTPAATPAEKYYYANLNFKVAATTI